MTRRDGNASTRKPRSRAQRRNTYPRPRPPLTLDDLRAFYGYCHGKDGVSKHYLRALRKGKATHNEGDTTYVY